MSFSAPRGTRDIKESEARAFAFIEGVARDVFAQSNYEEIRTPVFESTDLFKRAVGETTDIVEKEIFEFEDRGHRRLALRPEGTAGVVRAYLEHSWDKHAGGVKKLFYLGPMFRAERPQAGRYREFWQIGAEHFGNPAPMADYGILSVTRNILEAALGGQSVAFELNSIGCAHCRPAYRQALTAYLTTRREGLCEDCRRRIEKNPLRALDCKVDGAALRDAPTPADHLCDACRAHAGELKDLLSAVGFAYRENPRLVRGLDYYTRTVFEVTCPALGAQNALAAGGRYDNLVKAMGGADVPAVGFALGLDRLVSVAPPAKTADAGPVKVFVVLAGAKTIPAGLLLVKQLRLAAWLKFREHFAVEIGDAGKSLKAQFRAADAWGAAVALVLGEDELAACEIAVKDLKTGRQEKQKVGSWDEPRLGDFAVAFEEKLLQNKNNMGMVSR